MKRAVNLRLDENMVITLNRLAEELNTTKTEVIERALQLFSKTRLKEQNDLLQYAGVLKGSEADRLLDALKEDKNRKEFEIDAL